MFRIILAILAAGILAACDNDTTGPTADGGEVEFRLFRHNEYSDRWTGEGYIFAKCEKVLLTAQGGVKVDIGAFPANYPNPDVMISTSGQIYKDGEPISRFYLNSGESADFELVTFYGKSRYKISARCKYRGVNEKRTGKVYKIFMRYKLLNT